MGRPFLLMRGNQEGTMLTQIMTCFNNRGGLDRTRISADTIDFDSKEFDSSDFGKEQKVKDVEKITFMTQLSTMKNIPSSKVAWEDTSLITSATDKSTVLNDSNKKPSSGHRRRPSFYDDFSTVTSSKVMKCLSKFDEDLGNIGLKQSPETTETIITVNKDDLQKIKLLGNGQFCNVHSVDGSLPHLQQDPNTGQPARKRTIFALKSINPKRVADDDELIIAASDLAKEAKILSELDHKNIIKLRGLSCETFSKSFMDGLGTGCRNSSHKSLNRSLKRVDALKRLGDYKLSKPTNGIEGYFLILDVLTEVLSDRLIRERSDKFRTKQPKGKFRRQEAMYARIEHTVTGIVAGMRYLHSLDIVLRDLKPGNVGFDEDMNVRLFDFGMARRVSECVQDEICGSPRYMAPEIMEGKGYTLKVDVYSFGILLYELCTLEVPFANSCALMKQKQRRMKKMFDFRSAFERNPWASKNGTAFNDDDDDDSGICGVKSPHANRLIEFYKKVVFDELRPSNNNLESVIPCPQISKLIKECWSADPDKRPSFDEIATRLEAIFNRNHTKRTQTQYCH